MNVMLRQAFDHEMQQARAHCKNRDLAQAFHHLERAHILGQRDTWRHVLTHVWMLRIGWQQRSAREVLGQLLRIPAALLFSRVWVPIGNTGGANVSALAPMRLPADMEALLTQADEKSALP